MTRESHLRVLRLLLDRMEGSKVDWAVTGSLGLALQGMDVPINDIDIQTDEDGAYEMERRLAEFVTSPVLYKASQRMRSRLGKLMIEGVQVEIIGDIQKVLEDGSWESPVRVADHRVWIDLHGQSVPVLSLEYEYEAYRLMGRTDRAQAIRKWLDKHSGA